MARNIYDELHLAVESTRKVLAVLGVCANAVAIFFIIRKRFHRETAFNKFMLAILFVDLLFGVCFASPFYDVSRRFLNNFKVYKSFKSQKNGRRFSYWPVLLAANIFLALVNLQLVASGYRYWAVCHSQFVIVRNKQSDGNIAVLVTIGLSILMTASIILSWQWEAYKFVATFMKILSLWMFAGVLVAVCFNVLIIRFIMRKVSVKPTEKVRDTEEFSFPDR